MDVFNQPPSIAEDTLRFRIHSATPSLASVTALRTLIVNFVENELLPPTHIWHRDSLQFNVVSELGASPDASSTVIEGNIRVGDAVDDEWLVVWLLFEISRKWDVIISVSDSDGEFLLIEAAESLPKWVTPENVENRVWIYQSRLHLIPLDRSSTGYDKSKRRRRQSNYSGDEGDFSRTTGDDDQWISVPDALKVVRDPSVPTTTSEGVQSIIQRKISRYPAATQKHIHITNAYIPSDIALALSQNRGLIQKSVEAFYTRDALQLRAASKMARFPPDTSILASVAMTRTAYAQLSGQRFHAPKVFGREWSPPAEGTAEWRWRDIGMKIACGFEMLYAETRSKSSQVDASQGVMPRHAARSPAYDQYMSDLKRGGWFGEEIEGSEKWKERQRQADESWNETLKDKEKEEDGHASSRNQRTPFSRLVEEAVAASAPKKDAILFQNAQPPVEDSDDWLNVSSADIETMLAGSLPVSGKTKAQGVLTDEDDETKHTTEKLANLAQKVDKFVMDPEEKGDLDGAIFDDDDDAADEDSIFSNSEDEGKDKALSDDLDSSASDSEKEEVAAEARRRAAMDALVAPLGPDEYGKLPAVPAPLTDADMDIGGEAKTRSKAKLEPVQMRKPILVRDKFDGVDSDDETSSEDEDATGDDAVKRRELLEAMREEEGVVDADDEAFPQVVDGGVDMEVDMAAEEEAFLKFAREELGVNEDMWNGILDERKGRGAFIPASAGNTKTNAVADSKVPAIDTTWFKPSKGGGRQKHARFMDAISRSDDAQPASALTPASTKASKEEPLIQPRARNPNLDSFEAVMEAMDVELQKARESRKQGKEKDTSGAKPQNPAKVDKGGKGKGKGKQTHISSSEDEDEDDMDSAMDAELRASLRRGASGEGSRSDSDGEVEDATMDYNLIKNFLESFKSQAGTAGPVSSLAGRLEKGWTLPRDESG